MYWLDFLAKMYWRMVNVIKIAGIIINFVTLLKRSMPYNMKRVEIMKQIALTKEIMMSWLLIDDNKLICFHNLYYSDRIIWRYLQKG